METISFEVEPEIARAYRAFKPQSQQQFQALMTSILKRSLEESLEDIVADLRDEAESNGLTPEILEKLLEDE
ncbi:hypothetical protein [Pseudanabaena sp. ABRG5-3]|uniref:hypothetical protein n=1 Tax=Pseudanabaena sp. ABRG5-3 TaxID=685565 RepID=UPI000DC6E9AF|nr:hypothetical protein [Pseudanabaena sp. ABRG5-3]BBC24221.1 hypothetical protein ABRG53_1964 [Pseudanabaena sp. ABRG5-3]